MVEISILVPVYNVEKYLEACLDSILQQTYTDFEVICMDDGSTDRSGDILDAYAIKDKRIRVIHKSNSGYGETMNAAVQLAKGKYIGIVESDDTIECDMYQVLHDTITKHGLDLVKTDFYAIWDNKNGTVRKQYCSLTNNREMYNNIINPHTWTKSYLVEKFTWNALYKKELIIENNVRYNETPGASYQDNGFWFQTFYWAKRVMFLDRAFYNYRQDNVHSSVFDNKKVYDMKNEFDFIRKFMVDHRTENRELYQICFHWRMLAYIGTLERIDLQFKLEFAKTIEKERRFYEGQKEACYDYMTEKQLAIIKDPVAYVEDVFIRFREITKVAISGYDNIIVYGAGEYGKRIICQVKEQKADAQTVKVAVTSLEGERIECQGETICEISECMGNKGVSLVILAVKEGSAAFYDMLGTLKKLQFPNIMTASAKKIDEKDVDEWKGRLEDKGGTGAGTD